MKTLEQARVISDRDRQLLTELKGVIHSFLPTAEVLLYGSVARGTQEPDSDYDVLILTDQALSKSSEKAVERAILSLELEREVVISTIYYSRDEWAAPIVRVSPFHAEVERDAIAL